jgi:hypothetical protein
MALTVMQDPFGVEWPLGYVNVSANGTPVNIMVNVDPSNNNAPWQITGPGFNSGPEYTPRCHKVTFQAMKPAANNNGMVTNNGNVYIVRSQSSNNFAGAGNRADPGAMVWVLPPGSIATLPADEMDRATISPYRYSIDTDNNNEGALVTLLGCER